MSEEIKGTATAVALGLWLAVVPAARAAPADHLMEAAPIARELARTYDLPAPEEEALKTEVAIHLDRGGDAAGARDLAAAVAGTGCEAGCLAQALGAVNRAVWLGHPEGEARKLVIGALKDSVRDGGPGTLAERMEARMERLHRESRGFE